MPGNLLDLADWLAKPPQISVKIARYLTRTSESDFARSCTVRREALARFHVKPVALTNESEEE